MNQKIIGIFFYFRQANSAIREVQKVDQGFILSRDSRSVYLTALVAFLGISICRRLCDDSVMLRWRVSIPLLTNKQKQNPHYILCILLGTLKILDYDSSPVK